MRRVLTSTVAVLALLLAGCTTAAPAGQAPSTSAAEPPPLLVEDAWVRTTTGAKDPSMTAAFLTIVNPGDADVRLVGADYAGAGLVQVHEMVMVDGTMRMQEAKDGVVVPAGSHAHLTPGAEHVMLMQLRGELAVGDEVALTLRFSDSRSVEVVAPVKEFVEEEDHYHSPEPSEGAGS